MRKKNSSLFENYFPNISDDLIHSSSKDTALTEKKQAHIREAASKLFFEKGFHGTNIREIAAESGMSMGQLYHYISSKDDILFLVYKHMQELWYGKLVEIGFEEIEDPLARFVRALRTTVNFPAENKKLFQFVFSESKYLDKEHLKVILDMDNKNVSGFFKKLLEEVNKEYPIDYDLNLAARMITFMSVFISIRAWDLKEWDVSTIIDFMVMFILKALGLPSKKTK